MTSRAAHRPHCCLPFYVSLSVLSALELGVGVIVVRGCGLEKGGKTCDFGGQMLTTHQKFKMSGTSEFHGTRISQTCKFVAEEGHGGHW